MGPNPDKLPITPLQRVVRYIGAVVLSACTVMLVLGLTVLEDRLHGFALAQYWVWCFLLAIASMVCAVWDMLLVRRSFKQTRRQIFRQQFMTGELGEKLKKRRDDEK